MRIDPSVFIFSDFAPETRYDQTLLSKQVNIACPKTSRFRCVISPSWL